jgi:hypothetical protein
MRTKCLCMKQRQHRCLLQLILSLKNSVVSFCLHAQLSYIQKRTKYIEKQYRKPSPYSMSILKFDVVYSEFYGDELTGNDDLHTSLSQYVTYHRPKQPTNLQQDSTEETRGATIILIILINAHFGAY